MKSDRPYPFVTIDARGAKRMDRVGRGIKSAVVSSVVFALLISVLVFVFAKPLLLLFVKPEETEILAVGVQYLRIEGAFYFGIGILFLASCTDRPQERLYRGKITGSIGRRGILRFF